MMEVSVYQLIQSCFVYLLVMCLCLASAYENGTCSSRVIDRKETACFAQYNLSDAFLNGLPLPAELTYYNTNMVNLCRNLGDITHCLAEAMTPCKSPYFDYGSYKNTLEKICLHQKTFKEAESHCDMIDVLSTCLKLYREAVEELKYHVYLNRPGPPLADICTVLENTRECIYINETVTCIRKRSQFLTALYRGRFMPSVCAEDSDPKVNGDERISFSALYSLLFFHIWKTFCVLLNYMSSSVKVYTNG